MLPHKKGPLPETNYSGILSRPLIGQTRLLIATRTGAVCRPRSVCDTGLKVVITAHCFNLKGERLRVWCGDNHIDYDQTT